MEFILLALGLGAAIVPLAAGDRAEEGDDAGTDRLDADSAGGAADGQDDTADPAATVPGDTVIGSWRWERYWGEAGDDWMDLRGGDDFANGAAGDDTLQGGSGDDALLGSSGDDLLRGGEGEDWISAGAGLDSVFGGAGNDVIYGSGPGRDYAETHPAWGDGQDYLDGGGGNDAIRAASNASSDGSTLIGGGGDDTLTSIYSGNTLIGGRGDDEIAAAIGNDVWLDGRGGGHGDDLLTITAPAPEADSIDVAPGPMVVHDFQLDRDQLVIEDANKIALSVQDMGDDLVLYGDGEAMAVFIGRAGTNLETLLPDYEGVRFFTGTAGPDALEGTGGNDTLLGMAGMDRLTGADGDDFVDGGEGDDRLLGGAGSDRLFGGHFNGADTLEGGAGADSLYGWFGNDLLLDSSAGDLLDGGDGNDLLIHDIHGPRDFETDGAPIQTEGAATLVGGGGADTLIGASGDVMRGDEQAYWGKDADLFVIDITQPGVAVVEYFDPAQDSLQLNWSGSGQHGYLTLQALAEAGVSVTQEVTAKGLLIANKILLKGLNATLPV